MRSSRLIAVLVALVLAAFVPMSTAQASTGSDSARARAEHVVRYEAGEIRQTGRFIVKGKALTYKNRNIRLQKANCKRCGFRNYKADRTSSTGRFAIKFDGPRGSCYRLYIPGGTKYRTYVQVIGCIVAG